MHFEGTVALAASRQKTWAFPRDPTQGGSCGPGVESIEVVDETHFRARAKVGIGFISARFVMQMEMAELEAPSHATILAHGQAPGSAVDATAHMALRDGDARAAMVMDWSTHVIIPGWLARARARVIQGTAEK